LVIPLSSAGSADDLAVPFYLTAVLHIIAALNALHPAEWAAREVTFWDINRDGLHRKQLFLRHDSVGF
jgi:hypothetical protein